MARQRYWGLLAAGCLLLQSVCQAAAAPASNVMALEKAYPSQMGTALKAIRNNEKELAAYLEDPDTVCTVFVPSNQAMSDWMRWFGKYAGKAVQNTTFMSSALNYHVIPGQALTTSQIAKGGRQLTRANETVYFWKGPGGKPRVYSMHNYPVTLNQTDIKAGKCIVHSINMALVPPTSNQMVMGWMEELGTKPAPLPKSQWAPEQQPLPQSREALAAAAAAPTSSAVADTPASGSASKPASSDVQRPVFSVAGGLVVVVGVVAAAGLW